MSFVDTIKEKVNSAVQFIKDNLLLTSVIGISITTLIFKIILRRDKPLLKKKKSSSQTSH